MKDQIAVEMSAGDENKSMDDSLSLIKHIQTSDI